MAHERWLGGKPASFREVFPMVKSLRLTVTHHGDMRAKHQERDVYREDTAPARIPCPNPCCQQGGYELQNMLDALVHGREREYSVRWHCNGHEGTPKGRRRGDPCMNSTDLQIELDYREE